jgi:hypothetical protein
LDMVKEYTIKYNGKDEILLLEENPKAGVIMPLIKRTLKYKVGQNLPELDTDEWLIGIATTMIVKAPWKLQDVGVLKDMDWATYEQLAYIIGDDYPIERFLSLGAKLMYGKKLEISVSTSPTESTTSLPSGESPKEK